MYCSVCLSLSVCVACILKAMINRRLASVRLCQSIVYASVVCLRYEPFVSAFSHTHTHDQSETLVRPFIHSFIVSWIYHGCTESVVVRPPTQSHRQVRSGLLCGQALLRDRISVFTRSSRLHGRRGVR